MITLKRLNRLEEEAAVSKPADDRHTTCEEWFERLERMGRKGYFDREPDFPRALADLRSAMEGAKRELNPPWELPKYFFYDRTKYGPYAVLWCAHHSLALEHASQWLTTMIRRVDRNLPPITEAEFAPIAAWFQQNRERVHEECERCPTISFWDIHSMICAGVRGLENRKLFDELCNLKEIVERPKVDPSQLSVVERPKVDLSQLSVGERRRLLGQGGLR